MKTQKANATKKATFPRSSSTEDPKRPAEGSLS